jgi:transposase
MQGKKDHQEKLFVNFQLSNYVPADNFYRQLNKILDLGFLYKSTSGYYGREGQKSIDPVVFMKLMLVGYIENLNSDRRIIGISRMRMDILYFLGYDLDEELPWHSTLSRTRKLYGEEQFTAIFKQVLKLCIDKGLISGKRQAVDSALIQANASMDKMAERQVIDIMKDVHAYSKELEANSEDEPDAVSPDKPKDQAGDKKKPSHSNQTHYSPSDPDARLTKKPGKPFRLYYRSRVSVDTASHVITHIQAFPGNQADNTCLPEMLKHTVESMLAHNIQVKEILADSGYSSGEALQALIDNNLEGYIPNPANYMHSRDGFTYDPVNDWYTCPNGAHLTFRGIKESDKRLSTQKRVCLSSMKDCKVCPFKDTCAKKLGYKKISDTVDKHLYAHMHDRMVTPKAKIMSRLRSATVEPVLGSLINYTGMRRVNAKGIKQANKCMIMAAAVYNLKKLLKHTSGIAQGNTKKLENSLIMAFTALLAHLKLSLARNFSFQF